MARSARVMILLVATIRLLGVPGANARATPKSLMEQEPHGIEAQGVAGARHANVGSPRMASRDQRLSFFQCDPVRLPTIQNCVSGFRQNQRSDGVCAGDDGCRFPSVDSAHAPSNWRRARNWRSRFSWYPMRCHGSASMPSTMAFTSPQSPKIQAFTKSSRARLRGQWEEMISATTGVSA